MMQVTFQASNFGFVTVRRSNLHLKIIELVLVQFAPSFCLSSVFPLPFGLITIEPYYIYQPYCSWRVRIFQLPALHHVVDLLLFPLVRSEIVMVIWRPRCWSCDG
jgi:hypothetical protein